MNRAPFVRVLSGIALLTGAANHVSAEQGLIVHKALSLDMAIAISRGALEQCRAGGYHCAVTVLDAGGRTMIAFQDDGAALHAFDVSRKKAYTSLVYRRPSKQVVEGWSKKAAGSAPLEEGTIPNPLIEGTIAFGGGMPILAGKEIVGAIGVSGAPGWEKDEACANAGIAKVAEQLK
jgi:uncharacterized protein GlcG (DUF336 family)